MENIRWRYSFTILGIVLLGIISRQLKFIPLFIGDLLYACMIYFICRLLLTNRKEYKSLIFSLSICYAIETLQCYDAYWMASIRNTIIGHYILGQGFLWSDLVAYTIGGTIAFLSDRYAFNKKSYN